ncbi:MAG TPA: SRPBCC family protein [Gemmatimonadales bacterium]|nr:SRPBCC family protein [Gemmatimonadales bacterium]
MRTIDRIWMNAPMEPVFHAAMDVERWPSILAHYRWVRILERRGEESLVEMAAWRPFGRLRYPTWWVSEMWIDHAAAAVHYRHVRGITKGMDVVWRIEPAGQGTEVTIVHEWPGPRWPLIGPAAASWVIGPIFIHGIASRTLAGIKRHVEDGRMGRPAERGADEELRPEFRPAAGPPVRPA